LGVVELMNILYTGRMPSPGILCRVALVRTDVSEDRIAFIVRLRRLGELGIRLAVNSNRRKLRRKLLQEPREVTPQKTPFFVVTAVKTSNLTSY
jgi:hypothetical protein